MKNEKRRANFLFAGVVACLGGYSLLHYSFFLPPDPMIRPPAESSLPPGHPNLPENHPPLDYAKDLLALEEMSRNDPKNADYKTRIGNIYFDTGQYQKASEAYQQSLALRPNVPEVETDLATSLHYLGQHDRALELLDKVLGYRPDFPQALFNKGVVLQSGKKDTNGAVEAWERLLRTNPGLPQRAQLEERIKQLKAGAQ